MSFKLLTAASLLGAPLVALAGCYWAMESELRVDTSQAMANKIRPGMTLEEVQQIIGAPPGDYRSGATPEFQFVSGHRWPNVITWTSDRGRIDVTDGEHGFELDPRTS